MDSPTKQLVIKARDYQISQVSVQLLEALKPLVICGVTAAGKNATSQHLAERGNFERVVTHTTRSPRQGEANGQDYWFVSEQDMLEMIDGHSFVEVEVLNGDRVYGTSRTALELVASHGKRPIMTIDIKGAAKLAAAVSGLEPLFMVPPSTDVWMQRLGGRAYMSDGEHDRRLHGARGELEFVMNNQDFVIVVNNDVEQAAAEILRGVATDSGSQGERRALVKELYEYARSSNI